MRLQLCGVRGSTPAPGPDFVGIGGHTSCIALSHDDDDTPRLVLDAGSGLQVLTDVLSGAPFRGTIVLTHLHWDHMMGLPFFASGDHPESEVTLLVPEQGASASDLLDRAMSPPLFPITTAQLRGRWRFDTYGEGDLELEGFRVLARDVPHKGGRTMGLRVGDGGGEFAYIPDHSPHDLGPGAHAIGPVHDAARALATGADVLLHGSQFTRDELALRSDWGHAAVDYAVELAEACSVPRLVLIHHAPRRTDAQVAALVTELAARTDVTVEAGVQGDVVTV